MVQNKHKEMDLLVKWVPGHVDIVRNDRADVEAKRQRWRALAHYASYQLHSERLYREANQSYVRSTIGKLRLQQSSPGSVLQDLTGWL